MSESKWRMVPVDPTPEQQAAFVRLERRSAKAAYYAMLAAAPSPWRPISEIYGKDGEFLAYKPIKGFQKHIIYNFDETAKGYWESRGYTHFIDLRDLGLPT